MNIACPDFISAIDPEMCHAVDHYCERTSAAFDAEPVNAITNGAFLIASWGGWRLLSQHPDLPGSVLTKTLIFITALVGVGSFVFHTVGTRWAEWLDVLPILLFMLIYLWLVLTRFMGWSSLGTGLAVLSFFLTTFAIEALVPGTVLWGGAMYLPAITALVILTVAFHARVGTPAGNAFATATGIFLLSFAARSLDSLVCDMWPTGTHFLWHLLNALLLFVLIRVVIVHGPNGRATT